MINCRATVTLFYIIYIYIYIYIWVVIVDTLYDVFIGFDSVDVLFVVLILILWIYYYLQLKQMIQ